MNLEETLKQKLLEFKEEGSSLSVKWQGGGDELFMDFFKTGSEKLLNYQDPLLQNLMQFLVEEFAIPEVGAASGNGGGEIFLDENEEVMIRYDAYAHYFDEENFEAFVGGLGLEKGKKSDLSGELKAELEKSRFSQLEFSLHYEQVKGKVETSFYYFKDKPNKGEFDVLEPLLLKLILKEHLDSAENYSLNIGGKINSEGMVLEEVYGTPIAVYMDRKQHTKRLF